MSTIFSSNISFYFVYFASSNFGVALVVSLKEKLVIATEVIAAGPKSRPTMETVIITLMNLALHSEKVERQVYLLPFSFCSRILCVEGKDG